MLYFKTEWTPDYMTFSFDDEEIGRIVYPEGGMWEHGDFETDFPGIDTTKTDVLPPPHYFGNTILPPLLRRIYISTYCMTILCEQTVIYFLSYVL